MSKRYSLIRPFFAGSLFLQIIIIIGTLQGCGGADELGNVHVSVRNETDQMITVKFTVAYMPGALEERTTLIPPGEADVIKAYEYSNLIVIYNDLIKTYSIDCNAITGSCENITVRAADFV